MLAATKWFITTLVCKMGRPSPYNSTSYWLCSCSPSFDSETTLIDANSLHVKYVYFGSPAADLVRKVRKVHSPPEHYVPKGVSTCQKRILLIHCYSNDRHGMMPQELHLVVGALGQGVYVNLLVFGS